MRPLYHEINSQLEIFTKKNTALPPHLHKYLECIYITEGKLQLGIGSDWIEMNPNDLAIIFPDMIHEFRVDESMLSQAIYILEAPALTGPFAGILQKYYPRTPVIRRNLVHPDIPHALNALLGSEEDPYCFDLRQAYLQILLARALPVCELTEKREMEFSDLAWQAVSYISQYFKEDVSLAGMARKFGVSPYVLSRIFSGILHTNFNQYLNEIRLDYASHLLRTTDKSVTNIFIDSGFSSQTTFNRAFKTKYHISPRDYRRQNQCTGQLQTPVSSAGYPEKTGTGLQTDSSWNLAKGRFL
ncbi:MAG: AraC family transcriptional regulator [Eubacteriales bacterium]|nr:AraC family transcriptional regulator [Eubacteriales bacterium]